MRRECDDIYIVPPAYRALWEKFLQSLPVHPEDSLWLLQLQQTQKGIQPIPVPVAFNVDCIDITCNLKQGYLSSEEIAKKLASNGISKEDR